MKKRERDIAADVSAAVDDLVRTIRRKEAEFLWWEVHDKAHYKVVASCPTRDAAEAARRLLSGECLRRYNEGKADAQIDRLVAAKTGEGKPMCRSCERGRPHYEDGLADGAAQERAKIVKWLRVHASVSSDRERRDDLHEARHPWVTMANMAGRIERGEAGE